MIKWLKEKLNFHLQLKVKDNIKVWQSIDKLRKGRDESRDNERNKSKLKIKGKTFLLQIL